MRRSVARALLALGTASGLLAAAPAAAVTFNLNSLNAGTAQGTQARRGFEIAAGYWASVFTDNITINLNIGFSTLGTGILGSTGSTTAAVYNTAFYTALAGDRTSALDNSAVANLRPLTAGDGTLVGTGAVTFLANDLNAAGNGYVDTATRLDNDGSANNRGLQLNTSLAKATGITTNYLGTAINYGAADGSIQFSDAFKFDFDPTDGIDADAFDFIGVAIHEIGHALGFRSGVDTIDAYTSPGGTTTRVGALETAINVGTALDLFRYGTEGQLDWSTQGTPYFSIDGGANQLFGDSRFATGVRNGDGRQASHWKDSAAGDPQLGNLDPTSGRGQLQEVTALDLAAFDAIGWNVNFDVLNNSGYRLSTAQIYANAVGVPEPGSWAMMLLGAGLTGAAMRRRRRTRVAFAA
jgi:hypothetical protein